MLILHGHLHCLKGTLLLDGMVGKGFKGRFSLHRETASEALSRVLVQAGPPTSCGTCHEIYLSLSFWCLMGRRRAGPSPLLLQL